MIITNTQLHTATPTRTPLMRLNDLEDALDQCTYPEAYDELENQYWDVYEEVYGDEENGTLFTGIDTTYLTHLHDRIRFLTANAITTFFIKAQLDNPHALCLTQPVNEGDDLCELVDVMEETLRLESALGILDPWERQHPWE